MSSIKEKAGLERYIARLNRYHINRFWCFVRQNHAKVETEDGRLCLIINADQFGAFCDTFCEDDNIIPAIIKGHKLYIEARWLVPDAKKLEILAGKEMSDENN